MSAFGEQPNLPPPNSNEQLESWKKVTEFYQREFLCDIRLKVGRESKTAHKIVLSSLCPKGPWVGKELKPENPGDMVELDVSEVFKTPGILTTIIDYIYLGTVNLHSNTVLPILEVATQLILPELIGHCSQFLLEHIRINNLLTVWNLAFETNQHQLADICRVLAREIFRDVLIDNDDVKFLSNDFMEMLVQQTCVVGTVEPSKLAYFILQWLLDEFDERIQTAKNILEKVPVFKSQIIEICDTICKSEKVESQIKDRLLQELHDIDLKPAPFPSQAVGSDDSQMETGCWLIMVKDANAATVYCPVSEKWLSIPRVTYSHVISLSQRRYLTCTNRKPFAATLDIVDITATRSTESIDLRGLIDESFLISEYIGHLYHQDNRYLLLVIDINGRYELVLYTWNPGNGSFEISRQRYTSIMARRIMKGLVYFNETDHTVVVLITSSGDITPSVFQTCDTFHVFQINWESGKIDEIIAEASYGRSPILTEENFMYCNKKIYLFDHGLDNNLVHAVEFNLPVTVPVMVFELGEDDTKSYYKSISLPPPGLNILPLKPKLSKEMLAKMHRTNLPFTTLRSPISEQLQFNFKVQPIEDKLFLVFHRAPGIINSFVVDIFAQTWKSTQPLPLTGMTDIEVTLFYSDMSIDKAFPEGRKEFDSTDFPIFDKWCLQQWQGYENINSDS